MTAVVFIKLKTKSIERELFERLEDELAKGRRALVCVATEEEMNSLDTALWAVDANSFLPHSTTTGRHLSEQPVLLSVSAYAPNNAKTLFILPGATINNLENFDETFVLFDERRANQVEAARTLWQSLKNKGVSLVLHTNENKKEHSVSV